MYMTQCSVLVKKNTATYGPRKENQTYFMEEGKSYQEIQSTSGTHPKQWKENGKPPSWRHVSRWIKVIRSLYQTDFYQGHKFAYKWKTRSTLIRHCPWITLDLKLLTQSKSQICWRLFSITSSFILELPCCSTASLWYPQRIGSRTLFDTKIHRCTSPLYKMA